MPDHSQCLIIHDQHFNWKVLPFYPFQFLDIHLESSVSTDTYHRSACGIISADSCRKSISHSSVTAGKQKFLALAVLKRLIAPDHMLTYIHGYGRSILQHITEICDHTVGISLRSLVIYCLKVLFDLPADLQPVPELLLNTASFL